MEPRPALAAERLWLDVPFAEKDDAKAHGARWDPSARRWYAPRPGIAALGRWAAKPALPHLLPGEDRNFGSGLFIDLVPNSCWFTNVRSCAAGDWDRIRRMVYDRAGQRCEACGAAPDPSRGSLLEAHERWAYDPARHVQSLRRLVCLCSACHEVTHIGLATIRGNYDRAVRHLRAVNHWTAEQADQHEAAAWEVWERRSACDWTLDLSVLTAAGIHPTPPGNRRAAARQGLADTGAGPRPPSCPA